MESQISKSLTKRNFKFNKKLSPTNKEKYFIKIDDNQLNLNDIYNSINEGNSMNPTTNTLIKNHDIIRIQKLYKNILTNIEDNKTLLNDYIDYLNHK